MSPFSKVLVGFASIALLGIAITVMAPKNAGNAAPAVEPKSGAHLAKETLYRNATEGALTIRRAMKDPASFELSSADDHGAGIVCYQFRSKNSFGASVPDSAVLTSKGDILLRSANGNKFVAYWNQHCAQPGGTETTGHVQTMLSTVQ